MLGVFGKSLPSPRAATWCERNMDAVASDLDDRLDIGLEGVADNRYLKRWDKFHMADVRIFLDAFFVTTITR